MKPIIIKFREVAEIFELAHLCWNFKESLLLFLYDVYLDVEFDIGEDANFIWIILNTMNNDIEYIYNAYFNKTSRVAYQQLATPFEKAKSMKSLAIKYMTDGALTCLETIFLELNLMILPEKEMMINDMISNICLIYESLENTGKYFKMKQTIYNIIDSLQKNTFIQEVLSKPNNKVVGPINESNFI